MLLVGAFLFFGHCIPAFRVADVAGKEVAKETQQDGGQDEEVATAAESLHLLIAAPDFIFPPAHALHGGQSQTVLSSAWDHLLGLH